MEFLVRIEVGVPPGMPGDRWQRLLEAEAERGRELIAEGSLVRIWRLPGRRANVSLYRAADATRLHELISSLPLYPWLEVSVEALATHPLEA